MIASRSAAFHGPVVRQREHPPQQPTFSHFTLLQRIVLDQFRNYRHQELLLAPGVNALIGENGQGKTNLLEAVYYLSLLRSFRTSQVNNLVAYGSQSFTLFGEVLSETESGRVTRLGVSNGRERRLMIDGQSVRKASEFISRLVCAAFLPGDLAIVQGAPGVRRSFLNIALCQLYPNYLIALQSYNEALQNRNAMLKTPDRYPRGTVTAYDQVLAQHGASIEVTRQRFGKALDQAVRRQSEFFFPDGRQLSVKFLSGIQFLLDGVEDDEAVVAAEFLDSLNKNYERDCREGSTRLGPQRSDLACQLNGKPLAQFGSEGECRIAAIALRFGVLELLREQKDQSEITMIVDDVLGELDATRRDAFLQQLVASGQVIFAGTSLPPGFGTDIKSFRVERGTVAEG
ncbi:MAG: DNA replication and repair protein RecF [Victivallales bacterium]|nr:DNA replication and repair protein RecF [Victivallales bacterium]